MSNMSRTSIAPPSFTMSGEEHLKALAEIETQAENILNALTSKCAPLINRPDENCRADSPISGGIRVSQCVYFADAGARTTRISNILRGIHNTIDYIDF